MDSGNRCSSGTGASAYLIDAGRRLHLQHGPIDLIIDCTGSNDAVMQAYRNAAMAFEKVLQQLSDELPLLRSGSNFRKASPYPAGGPVARRMFAAIEPYADVWLSPMITVAGAVADHILAEMQADIALDRILINNGGDIALHLNDGQLCRIGVCPDPRSGVFTDTIELTAISGIGGVATSGWRGRSHSMGIADAVTVLSKDAATADVAATLIANAVDLPMCSAITRVPASELNPDSDLGALLVTTRVESLSIDQKHLALNRGMHLAERYHRQGLVMAAYLSLQGERRLIGNATSLYFNRYNQNQLSGIEESRHG